jgi:hypothetical protein
MQPLRCHQDAALLLGRSVSLTELSVMCREMKIHRLLTKLDEAPWTWGSTGGWANGMPAEFQSKAPCLGLTCMRTARTLSGQQGA